MEITESILSGVEIGSDPAVDVHRFLAARIAEFTSPPSRILAALRYSHKSRTITPPSEPYVRLNESNNTR